MKNKWITAGLTMFATASVLAQGTVSVDLLDPGETNGTIPSNLRIVDVFVDIATTDYFTASGIRAVTSHGATFAYHDRDANIPGIQPGLFNPGLSDKFLTSLSKPRNRDANNRFTNAAAAAAGGYNPPSPNVLHDPTALSVAYFAAIGKPPWRPPSVDGYIARISIDVSAVPNAPSGNDDWAVGTEAPAGATVVLSSVPPPQGTQSPGTVIATFDLPAISGINWQLWFVPEPASGAALVVMVALSRRRTLR